VKEEQERADPPRPPSPGISAGMLVVAVCVAQVLAQIGAYTWPSLLPGFLERWSLDNRQAGWITGIFYAAYVCSVPVLVSLTDRVDPRRIYLLGVGLTTLSHAGFALIADDFASALALRALGGVGWAGTYMTGLKLLADRVDGRLMSRAVSGHAASIGVAGALSFAVAGGAEALLGWRGAFALSAGCAASAVMIAVLVVPAQARDAQRPVPAGRLLDFRPVLRNRPAMAYAVAYCVHTWEMNALRGWSVAFLTWVAMRTGGDAGWLAPAVVVTAMGLLGTATSIAGNELSIRAGRVRLVRVAMLGSVLCATGLGAIGSQGYLPAMLGVLLYGGVIWLDSSSLTAGAAGSAEPGRRGATLALHSMLGYGGGFIGPVMIGWILDLYGGMTAQGWSLAFAHLAVAGVLGRLAFELLGPRGLDGDRR
jgi:MFS family permease